MLRKNRLLRYGFLFLRKIVYYFVAVLFRFCFSVVCDGQREKKFARSLRESRVQLRVFQHSQPPEAIQKNRVLADTKCRKRVGCDNDIHALTASRLSFFSFLFFYKIKTEALTAFCLVTCHFIFDFLIYFCFLRFFY